jgi:hypothetical protein
MLNKTRIRLHFQGYEILTAFARRHLLISEGDARSMDHELSRLRAQLDPSHLRHSS